MFIQFGIIALKKRIIYNLIGFNNYTNAKSNDISINRQLEMLGKHIQISDTN